MDRQLLRQKCVNNLSNENIKTGVSREMTFEKYFFFWHFNSRFVLKTTETLVYVFITEII